GPPELGVVNDVEPSQRLTSARDPCDEADDPPPLTARLLDLLDQHGCCQVEIVRMPVRQLTHPVPFIQTNRRLDDRRCRPVGRRDPGLRIDPFDVSATSAMADREQTVTEIIVRGKNDIGYTRTRDRERVFPKTARSMGR